MNLKEEAKKVTEYFSPRIISEVNDQYVKIARIKGQDVPWHNHTDEDELFYMGLSAYGAVFGERGGFFTGGLCGGFSGAYGVP